MRLCIGWNLLLVMVVLSASSASAQFVSNTELRPFVVGVVPVVGRSGVVGGISIDPAGAVSRTDVETLGRLREARLHALAKIDSDVAAISSLRKVSLRGLARELERTMATHRRLDDSLQCLAGITRIEYVFAFPEQKDIVLAGPAESWRIDEQGNVVGQTSGQATLQLDDLLVALRCAKAAGMDRGISCSIDPTEEGLNRIKPLLQAPQLNTALVDRLELALGPQRITVTGVPVGSRYAQVLVAADFLMKRLGMNFENAPIKGMPSYLELLAKRSAPPPKNAMPRWWMAPNYEPLLKDNDGLAWQLRGTGVQCLTEDGYLSAAGSVVNAGRIDPLAKKWADTMTSHFPELAKAFPVFGALRNCMDLSVFAALLVKEDLAVRTGCDLSLLLDEKRLPVAEFSIPKTIDSRASLIRRGNDWLLSLSGGVQVDSWSVVQNSETRDDLGNVRQAAGKHSTDRWWWD